MSEFNVDLTTEDLSEEREIDKVLDYKAFRSPKWKLTDPKSINSFKWQVRYCQHCKYQGECDEYECDIYVKIHLNDEIRMDIDPTPRKPG